MKLLFNGLVFIITFSYINCEAGTILMSGQMNQVQRVAVQKIVSGILGGERLVSWESNNPACAKKVGFLLQLCWEGRDFQVVYQKRRALEKSVGRLMELVQREKALTKKASL